MTCVLLQQENGVVHLRRHGGRQSEGSLCLPVSDARLDDRSVLLVRVSCVLENRRMRQPEQSHTRI